MKIALTGANGFVGRHVTAELVRHGNVEIVASSRAPAQVQPWPERVSYVPLDIAAPPADALDRLGRPDVLIHLAWAGLPNYRSLHHFEDELPIQYRFLRGLIEAGLPSLLVSGTCYEYGMTPGCLTEGMPATPANPYGFAKASLLEQLRYLKVSRPFALTWARLFYMHGEGQAPTSLYPLLRAAVERGDKIFAMSSGEQLRDYLPIADVARLLVDLAMRKLDAGVVNVCSGEPISVRGLIETFLAQNNWSIALDRGKHPIPDYEPMAFWGSAQKLRRLLGAS
jgi:dTDP-6-deoxy-L-talose 4-dehydrogenase (NAD+)